MIQLHTVKNDSISTFFTVIFLNIAEHYKTITVRSMIFEHIFK